MKIYKAIVKAISPMTGLVTEYKLGVISAESIEEAFRYYEEEGMPYVTLVEYSEPIMGVVVKADDSEDIDDLEDSYLNMIKPRDIIKNMSYDDFIDWLDIAESEEDVISAIVEFEREGLMEHVKIMKIYLKNKYGKNKEDEEENS